MNTNPYEPPRSTDAAYWSSPNPASGVAPTVNQTMFILAAVGAWFASVYWAVFTLLAAVGAAWGGGSFFQVVLPCYLIAMYAIRGFQIVKGDPVAAQKIILLHVMGAIFAVVNAAGGEGVIIPLLQSAKVLIHIFGGITAYLARRSFEKSVVARY